MEADAQHLPFDDETFDAATMISMLHHVEDRSAALAEARRILRAGGRLALMAFTGEDAATLWILEYFPSSRRWMQATHPPRAAILDELPGARFVPFEFKDMQDASLAALSADPERVLNAAERGDTSYFERMSARPPPDELQAGLARLRARHTGRPRPEARRHGHRVEAGPSRSGRFPGPRVSRDRWIQAKIHGLDRSRKRAGRDLHETQGHAHRACRGVRDRRRLRQLDQDLDIGGHHNADHDIGEHDIGEHEVCCGAIIRQHHELSAARRCGGQIRAGDVGCDPRR